MCKTLSVSVIVIYERVGALRERYEKNGPDRRNVKNDFPWLSLLNFENIQ